MGFLFWRSIQTTQNILGFGLTDLPHEELKQKINKEIMTEKAISCSTQKWCTNNYSKVKILQIRDFNLIHGWTWLLMHDPIHRSWKWKEIENLKIFSSCVPWKREHLLLSLRWRTEKRRKAEIAEKMKVTNTSDTRERVRDADNSASSLHRYNYHLILGPWHTVVASTLCVGH